MVRRWENATGPSDILHGLTDVATGAGRSVVWLDMDSKAVRMNEPLPSPEVMRARGVEAALVWPEVPSDLRRLRAWRAAMPLVMLDRRVPGFESDFVGFDDAAGGRRITEHLLALGHRRIGFLSGEPSLATVQARVQGYAMALEDAGIMPWPEWILYCEGARLALPTALLRSYLDGSGEPLTAIVCANDIEAAQLIVLLRGLGRRVPEDVAVTGFGNMLSPLLDALRLTTMAQPFTEMGRLAGEQALARLAGRTGEVEEVELPMELVVRGSCGATPA